MHNSKKILFFLFFFLHFTFAHSEGKVVILNIDEVLNNSLYGKTIVKKLDKLRNDNLNILDKKKDEIKKKEESLQKQKNIISKEEFKLKLTKLEKEISEYNKFNQERSYEYDKSKKIELDKFLKKINPIIQQYVQKNSISVVVNKKNVFIANKDYDITGEIITMVDNNVK